MWIALLLPLLGAMRNTDTGDLDIAAIVLLPLLGAMRNPSRRAAPVAAGGVAAPLRGDEELLSVVASDRDGPPLLPLLGAMRNPPSPARWTSPSRSCCPS